MPVQREVIQWQKPPDGWVKANADGALAKSHGSGGGGAVLRDCHGEFLGGSCHFFPSAYDPETVELQACRRAIFCHKSLMFRA